VLCPYSPAVPGIGMTSDRDDQPAKPQKPLVFISYPFRPRTEWIKHNTPQLLRLYGCQVASGDNYPGQGISAAVAADIGRSNLLVAFFTKDQKLATGEWAPSQWVLQEIGFARGRGIPVVLIREEGVFKEAGILGDAQIIPLDAEREAFAAFVRLRSAIKNLLFPGQFEDGLSVCHLAKPGRKDSWNQQWWDVWAWIDGSEENLDSIAEVHYEFPEAFSPRIEEGDPRGAFGVYAETDAPITLKVRIRRRQAHEPRQLIVRHKITLPYAATTPIPKPVPSVAAE
jgi:hypothetical protein